MPAGPCAVPVMPPPHTRTRLRVDRWEAGPVLVRRTQPVEAVARYCTLPHPGVTQQILAQIITGLFQLFPLRRTLNVYLTSKPVCEGVLGMVIILCFQSNQPGQLVCVTCVAAQCGPPPRDPLVRPTQAQCPLPRAGRGDHRQPSADGASSTPLLAAGEGGGAGLGWDGA